MNSVSTPKVIVILGPTASGKSALAVDIARRVNGEVISADSRQVYKGLNIGSGKITKKEMKGVSHHLLDVASPKRKFTAADYKRLADSAVRKILKRGKVPVICGGTGFYIDALIYGYAFPEAKPDPKLRKKLEELTAPELFKKLRALDPRRARNIDARNKARLIRALEIITATGKRIPPPPPRRPRFNALKLGITRNDLAERIALRLARRLPGIIREARRLHARGLSFQRMEELGLEYRHAARFLKGEIKTKRELYTLLFREIRAYSKRQMTWFRRDARIIWIPDSRHGMKIARDFIIDRRGS